MRVLLFDHFLGESGHHVEYAGHIARYLGGEGDDVTLATWARPPSSTLPGLEEVARKVSCLSDGGSNSRMARFMGWPLIETQGVHRCLRLALREDVDIVHFLALDRSELAVLASLSLRTHRPAVFGTLFKPYFVHAAHETVDPGRRLFHDASRLALGRLLRRDMMQGLFVHSDRIKSLLQATLSADIPSGKIAVVPDPAKEPPTMTKEQARAELGLPGDTPMILFFGGMRHDKGPDILLRALSALDGDWLAVLAGKPATVGEREADACRRTLPASGRLVTRFEFVPEPDADRYFRAADVVVLPYRTVFDGTSGVLQRAAAAGKAVIASDVGDVGPAVREAGLGTVVPPESHEALAAALQDFLGRRDEVQREVEPRALDYARANDWRILGAATRASYLLALRSRAGEGASPGVSG